MGTTNKCYIALTDKIPDKEGIETFCYRTGLPYVPRDQFIPYHLALELTKLDLLELVARHHVLCFIDDWILFHPKDLWPSIAAYQQKLIDYELALLEAAIGYPLKKRRSRGEGRVCRKKRVVGYPPDEAASLE